MCVAVVVESKEQIPLVKLEAMESANDDGGGVAWAEGNVIHYKKGLTAKQIFELQDKLPRPFFLHFRIATRGKPIPQLTHPFPVGMQSFDEALEGTAPAVIMHNGTWPDFDKWVPEGMDSKLVSDTQTAAFVAGYYEDILEEVKWSNAIMKAAGNGRCNITLRGNWDEDKDMPGVHFSNFHWKSHIWRCENKDKIAKWSESGYSESWRDHNPHSSFYGNRTGTLGPRTVTPKLALPPVRKKGDSQTEGPRQLSKRKLKKLAKAAVRAQKKALNKAPKSSYDQAVENYNKGKNAHIENYLKTEVKDPWDSGEEVFTPAALAKAENENENIKSVRCEECNQEVELIPCPCNNWTVEQWIDHAMKQPAFLDSIEEAQMQGSFDFDSEEDTMELSQDALDKQVIDINDVEDLNAHGMSCGLDGGISMDEEIEDMDLVLDGNSPGDQARVDAFIRRQGVKIIPSH